MSENYLTQAGNDDGTASEVVGEVESFFPALIVKY